MSDYYLASAERKGASLFPSGLLMYDLPMSRRTASRPSTNTEAISRPLSRKRSPSPVSSSSSPPSSIGEEEASIDDEASKKTLTTSEDWWRQAIEPVTRKPLPTSHSAFSMIDDNDDHRSLIADTNPLSSLLPSFHSSSQRILVHNQPLITLTQIYTDRAADHVKQWYERQAVPSLHLLIKRGLLKSHREKSVRMSIGTKKEVVGQLDQHGKILCAFDNRSFDSVEHFYQTYQSRRKHDASLSHIYQCVRWYDQTFHSILLEYAETSVKVSGMQTRLIDEDELLVDNGCSTEGLTKEMLCQINCWNDGRNEIDL